MLLITTACGDSSDGDGSATDAGAIDRGRQGPGDSGANQDRGGTADTGGTDSGDTGVGTQDAAELDLSCFTDNDNDGHYALVCGGDDCDDNTVYRHGGLREICDFFDNDCNNAINDGITCTFFAHTDDSLFEVDPFLAQTRRLGDIPTFWDLDTHPDGTLYGITRDALYRMDSANDWVRVGALTVSGSPNGLAIDLDGNAFVTSGNFLYQVDVDDSSTVLVGEMGGDFESSGDCVINKDNTLFMSSKHVSPDTLVIINAETGVATNVGDTGYPNIYGLTAAWGFLFGLTDQGQVIQIDEGTGAAELVHTFTGRRWYGAASTPGR